MIAVRETSSGLADTLANAEGEENELTVDRLGVETKQLTPMFYSRPMTLMRDVSLSIVEATNGNGVEAWRLLPRDFNPTTHARCVQMVTEIISHKFHKNEEVFTSLGKVRGASSCPSERTQRSPIRKVKDRFPHEDLSSGSF